jgi:hypothetical protein
MGDCRFPQHAHGAAANVAYRGLSEPELSCGYFWGELPRKPVLRLYEKWFSGDDSLL